MNRPKMGTDGKLFLYFRYLNNVTLLDEKIPYWIKYAKVYGKTKLCMISLNLALQNIR